MTRNEYAIFSLGILLGLGLGVWIAAPSTTPDICPKGISGLWVCPQEWQTVFGVFGAVVAAGIAFAAARHTTDAVDAREQRRKDDEIRAFATGLAAEFTAIAAHADGALGYTRVDFEMPDPRVLDLKGLRREAAFDQEVLVRSMDGAGVLGPSLCAQVMGVRQLIQTHRNLIVDEINILADALSESELDPRRLRSSLAMCRRTLQAIRDDADHLRGELFRFADADDFSGFTAAPWIVSQGQ